MKMESTKMINNNLDYEKFSNATNEITTAATTTSTTIGNGIKVAVGFGRGSGKTSSTLKTDNIISSSIAAASANTRSNSNLNLNSNSNANTNTNSNTNDNGYFNRFDNRIAANLAAVINGARFRSSSCSKTSTSKSSNKTAFNTKNASNLNCSALRMNANNVLSNSSTNLHMNNVRIEQQQQQQQQHHLQLQPQYHFNGVSTLGNRSRQHTLPMHLQLNNVSSSSRPNSPLLMSNRVDDCSTGNVNVITGSIGSISRRRPMHLFSQANLNCNDNEKVAQTLSSDEDNSPTELNNCKRLADKPPLVKRLTMGLLRSNEDSRPLVNNATPTSIANITATNSTLAVNQAIYSNGYINEEAFEPEKFIASKFGDSCRQSLTAIPMLDTMNLNDNSEFNLKKRYLRETSSANSSPKIFANRLRTNAAANSCHYSSTVTTNTANAQNRVLSSLAFKADDDESDLKDACWFQAGISREIAVEVLSSKSPGAFLVRKSSSKPGCYALTLSVPSPPGPKIANYIILRTTRGYKIKGFRKEFSTLKALITHHSVMPELLPIPLAMPRPTNMTSSRRNLDDFDTYDSLQMLLKYLRAKNLENGE